MTEGRVIPIEGHVRRGNSMRSQRRRVVAPALKARRGRGGVGSRTPRWSRARWRWLLVIGGALFAGAAIAGRISRPLKPPRIFDAMAIENPAAFAGDRSLDNAARERLRDASVMKSGAAISGESIEAREADEIADAIERRRLPNRLPR